MLPRANASLIGPAVNCLTVVSVDNLAIRSDRADADQAAMLYLAELANASMEARRDELAAMFGDLVMFGMCMSGPNGRIPPELFVNAPRPDRRA